MSALDRAILIAAKAHEGQTDKHDQPYILHPIRVMMEVDGEDAKIVAILHDVVEDTSVTLGDLRREFFSLNVLNAIALLIHTKEQSYTDYIVSIRDDPLARIVKLADLKDNSRIDRSFSDVDYGMKLYRKYALSYQFLTYQITEEEYRKKMDGKTKENKTPKSHSRKISRKTSRKKETQNEL